MACSLCAAFPSLAEENESPSGPTGTLSTGGVCTALLEIKVHFHLIDRICCVTDSEPASLIIFFLSFLKHVSSLKSKVNFKHRENKIIIKKKVI